MSFIILLVIVSATANASLGTTLYNYFNDDSAHSCEVYSFGGAQAKCVNGDVDYLEIKVQANLFQIGWVRNTVDGGYENSSPWTNLNSYYYTYVEWYFTGAYEDDGVYHDFRFTYDLYYMEGTTHHSVLNALYQYTSNDDWDNEFVSHYLGGVEYDDSPIYYLSVEIYSDHINSKETDFYDAAIHFDFRRVRFYYPGE